VIDPSATEISAMRAAAKFGGEYLSELGKTDFATMTSNEWMRMVDAICTGYVVFITTHPEPPLEDIPL